MRYHIVFTRSAYDQLASMPPERRERVFRQIMALAGEPRPEGVERLHGSRDYLRIRVGDYRVIFQIIDKDREILVIKIGHRRDVYRSV